MLVLGKPHGPLYHGKGCKTQSLYALYCWYPFSSLLLTPPNIPTMFYLLQARSISFKGYPVSLATRRRRGRVAVHALTAFPDQKVSQRTPRRAGGSSVVAGGVVIGGPRLRAQAEEAGVGVISAQAGVAAVGARPPQAGLPPHDVAQSGGHLGEGRPLQRVLQPCLGFKRCNW